MNWQLDSLKESIFQKRMFITAEKDNFLKVSEYSFLKINFVHRNMNYVFISND